MSLDSKHPLYAEHEADWRQMRDTYASERQVKDRGFLYLPPTSGMLQDGASDRRGAVGDASTATGAAGMFHLGNRGEAMYRAYRIRARFPDWVREAVKALLGVMHHKPPTIELPSQMETMRERATARNESLNMLLQRINEEQLVVGRVGILGDVVDQGPRTGDPYVALYLGETIINWDEGQRTRADVQSLNLVVLDESSDERVAGGFEWDFRRRWRVLVLGDPLENEPEGGGVYRAGLFTDSESFNDAGLLTPMVRGRTIDEIPFAFANAQDIVAEPDRPPLLGLSNLCLGIYRGEADYRQSLFMQGQDTLVVIGASQEDEIRVGASARIDLPVGGDAKYIGVDSSGLSEQRMALENDNNRALQMAGQLLDSVSRERESGEALRIRVAARTATLHQIVTAGAFALQSVLRVMARWLGADPEAVIITPNTDFVDDQMTGEELAKIMGAKMIGAPISLQTVHRRMADRGMTELTFDEELQLIEEERELELARRTDEGGSTSEDGPVEDEDEDEDQDSEDEDEDEA